MTANFAKIAAIAGAVIIAQMFIAARFDRSLCVEAKWGDASYSTCLDRPPHSGEGRR